MATYSLRKVVVLDKAITADINENAAIIEAAMNSFPGGNIQSNTILGSALKSNSIAGTKLLNLTIDSSKLGASSVVESSSIRPASSSRSIRSRLIRWILARECTLSVNSPSCAAVRLIASCPAEEMAMAIRAIDTCSPVVRSMSSSRLGGLEDTCRAREMRSSVELPMADTTSTTRLPSRFARMARRAAR